MERIKVLKHLEKLANDADQSGDARVADLIESMMIRIAQEHMLIGRPYQEGGKTYQRYQAPDGQLVIKELGALEGSSDKDTRSFLEKYNPFAGLTSALDSEGERAREEQKLSEMPHLKR